MIIIPSIQMRFRPCTCPVHHPDRDYGIQSSSSLVLSATRACVHESGGDWCEYSHAHAQITITRTPMCINKIKLKLHSPAECCRTGRVPQQPPEMRTIMPQRSHRTLCTHSNPPNVRRAIELCTNALPLAHQITRRHGGGASVAAATGRILISIAAQTNAAPTFDRNACGRASFASWARMRAYCYYRGVSMSDVY